MSTFLFTFLVFAVAILAMSVGVLVSGRRLSGSCGGVDALSEMLGDCFCVRKARALCSADDDSGLLGMAELGYPNRSLRHTNHGLRSAPGAGRDQGDEFPV